jgi:transcriptional regulator with PAS, ATPase and Fis domain
LTEETLRTGDRESVTVPPGASYLFVVFEADAPLAPPTRHALDEVDRVVFRRGAERRAERRVEGATRVLEISIADARMSQTHARMTRIDGGWTLEDLDSKNGTRVCGVARSSARLSDGDRFEIGHTHLRYRASALAVSAALDEGPARFGAIETIAPVFARELAVAAKLARSQVPLVLQAETGCGKEVLARALHERSGREGPFVAVNCGAIASNLIESELFGYRKGAFSGAHDDRAGLVRGADKGTLLLDEIVDLSASAQTALLRVLQEREVLPVGATRPVPIDVRFLAACQGPLRERADAGTFRADLLARLAGFTLKIPPLRERPEDLAVLVAALLRRLAPGEAERFTFTSAAAEAIVSHDWPFNVRELERTLETAIVLAGDDRRIALEHLPEALRPATEAVTGSVPPPARAAETTVVQASDGTVRLSRRDDVRRRELLALLAQHEGNVSAVARVTGKARAQIHRWLRRYGLDAATFIK